MSKKLTIAEATKAAADHLEKEGIENARRDAELLMLYLLKVEMADLIKRGSEKMPSDLQAQYSGLVLRRLRREPLQYITGRTEFWSREFYIDPRVLVPRPESEHIVEEVLKDHSDSSIKPAIIDVGTGSGVLAIVLALEFPKAKVYGFDVEPGALEVASINASRHNVTGRVEFTKGDLLSPAAGMLGAGSVDVIVSNPPYISESEIKSLAPEVAKSEPRRALVAGPTGLEVFHRLIPQAAAVLKPGGKLYLECGARQASQVEAFIESEPKLEHLRTAKDLQGIPRIVVGRKKE